MISHNKKAAPVLQHQDGRGEQTLLTGVRSSMSEYTTGHSSGQVEGLLLHGVENAIPASELGRMLGLRNARELGRYVEYERRHGTLILGIQAARRRRGRAAGGAVVSAINGRQGQEHREVHGSCGAVASAGGQKWQGIKKAVRSGLSSGGGTDGSLI